MVSMMPIISFAEMESNMNDSIVELSKDTVSNSSNNFMELGVPNEVTGLIIDIPVDTNDTIRVITSDKAGTYSSSDKPDETSVKSEFNGVSLKEILETKEQIEDEVKVKAAIRAKTYSETTTQGGLVDIANPDENYTGTVVNLSAEDKALVEKLVFGEAGDQGFIGAALVAQTIRDTWLLGKYSSMDALRRGQGYTGSINKGTSQECIDAVNYIFDQGGYAVKHRIMYFYAHEYIYSKWHETQTFVIQYKGHRVFDRNF